MPLIKFLINQLIQKVYEQLPDRGMMMCYKPVMPSDLLPEKTFNAFVESTVIKIILLFIGPLTSLILALQNAFSFTKRKTFSVLYAVYKAMRRILILTLILAIVLTGVFFLTQDLPYRGGRLTVTTYFKYFFITLLLINCLISGLVYLCFSWKGIRFLKLGLSLFFVAPGIIIFIIILFLSIIPKLNKYLPKDVVEYKRELLKKKLIDQGKFPEDVIKKNNEK